MLGSAVGITSTASDTVAVAGMAAGAKRSTRRSRLRGRSTSARTTEPRYRMMNPITATSHKCGPGPVEARDDVVGATGAAVGVVFGAAVVGGAAPPEVAL